MRSRMASVFIFLCLLVLAGCGGNASAPPAPSPTIPATEPTPSGPPPLSLYFSTLTTGAASAATPEAAAQSVVSALDASTGKLRWTYSARAQVQNVPVVDQDTLYVGADDHTVYALNAGDGSLRWKASVQGEPHVITVQNGVVYGDTELMGTAGRPTRGPLFALNARNGASVWLSQVNGSFFGLIDGAVYMVGADNQLYALDAGTGSARWHFQISGPFNGLRVVGGRVYLFTARAAGDAPSVVLYALDTSTGGLQWRYPVQVKDLENLSLVGADDSALYLLSSQQQNLGSLPLALALNASDGSVRWQYQASNQAAFTAATLDNGIVYLGTNTGMLVALNAQDGSLRWQTKATTTAMNIALVHAGVIYVSVSGEGVTALKTSSGAVLWRYKSADYVGISSARDPVLYGFSLSSSFSAASHNYVLALRESNGSLVWRYDAGTSSIFPVLSV